jgi:diguanylate cyclase (GGDEF)-like protein/PAS domain S-box-containing protein
VLATSALHGQGAPLDPVDAVPVERLRVDDDGDGVPDRDGDTVTVAGRAVLPSGAMHPERLDVPIQQGGRGIFLFDWDVAEPVAAGDSVVARGVVGVYRGRLQLQQPDYRVVPGPRRVPEPRELEIEFRRLERREGTIVEVEGELVRSTRNAGGRMLVLRGFADPDETVTVFLPFERLASFDLDRFAEGDRLVVEGVVGQYDESTPADGEYQLYPVGPDGIDSAGLTADFYRNLALGVGGALMLGFFAWGLTMNLQVRKRRAAQQRYESLFEQNPAGVAALEPDATVVGANRAFRGLTGASPQELEGVPFDRVVPEDVRDEFRDRIEGALEGTVSSFESVLTDGEGRRIHVEVSTVPIVVDDATRGVYVILEDITRRKEFEERLQHRALHDYLTELPNRALFSDRLEHAADRAERSGDRLAVLFLDIDRFKMVNDSAGHAAGDRLLQVVADRMREVARDGDTLARFGGDEFALLLEDVDGPEEALGVARRIERALERPVSVDGRTVRVSASVGIASSDAGEVDPRELLQRADQAMYRAKAAGGGRSRLYDEEHGGGHDWLQLENELRRALEEDELFVEYQPLVCLRTGRLLGLEALVRWDHPERGRLSPGSFIPVAERSGLVVQLDRWVLRRACVEVAAWQRRNPEHTPLLLSANLSARHFEEPDFTSPIGAVLAEAHGHEGDVQLEITESVAAREVERVSELEALGVRLAIDDFGTGYSALSYLRDLRADALKLDRSFVGKVDSDTASAAIARTVVTLGRTLDVSVVAEGIETVRQLRTVADFGCDTGQGFLFGEPARIREIDVRRLPETVARAVS